MAAPPKGPLANAPRDERDDFVGVGDSVITDGPPPRWPPKPRKITKDTFHAKVSGEGSIPRADRKPHFRKGGFVSGKAAGGTVKRQVGGEIDRPPPRGNVSRETSVAPPAVRPPVRPVGPRPVAAPAAPVRAARPPVMPVRPVVRRPALGPVIPAVPVRKDGGGVKRQDGGGLAAKLAPRAGMPAPVSPMMRPSRYPQPVAAGEAPVAPVGLGRKDGGKTKK